MGVNPFIAAATKDVGLRSIATRFRAYQLGEAGASYSYNYSKHFTLVEARRTAALSHKSLCDELTHHNRSSIDCLHITSWDNDHCKPADLEWILENLQPKRIEYPGYPPHTDSAKNAARTIAAYKRRPTTPATSASAATLVRVDPPYIDSLEKSVNLGYNDIFYHPKTIYENNSNNNSTVKLFRSGSFNVASLGDIEHENIGAMLRASKIFNSEVDVLILPHHGAPSNIVTKKFLESVRPTITICTSNFDNQYDHPCQEIRDILYELSIPIYTTKTGDVIVESIGSHTAKYRVTNLISNSTKVSSTAEFESKKAKILSQNADSIRNRYRPGFKGLI
ncbi:ComEC/Rec2 family competence protein [Burkholderia glumae]